MTEEGFDFIWCIENVPSWVKWVAQDSTGKVYGYESKPRLSNAGPYWRRRDKTRVILIGLAFTEKNWRESIRRIRNIRLVESRMNFEL